MLEVCISVPCHLHLHCWQSVLMKREMKISHPTNSWNDWMHSGTGQQEKRYIMIDLITRFYTNILEFRFLWEPPLWCKLKSNRWIMQNKSPDRRTKTITAIQYTWPTAIIRSATHGRFHENLTKHIYTLYLKWSVSSRFHWRLHIS